VSVEEIAELLASRGGDRLAEAARIVGDEQLSREDRREALGGCWSRSRTRTRTATRDFLAQTLSDRARNRRGADVY
jgi:hypothetical protein